MFPELDDYKGQDIIVTNGKTLLGADDKGGVAAIIAAMKYLKDHPEIEHGKIRVGFTPDEEIGAGADYFDVEKFGCEWAYTIDGGQIGELEYENFNAAGAKVVFKGLNVHPGYAKDKMLNASLLAVEFASWLPVAQRPEHTTGYEGFFHLTGISGTVEEASLSYIIRDHVRTAFERKKELLHELVKRMNEMHPGSTTLELRDQYYNMREVVEPKKFIVDLAFDAMKEAGVTPLVKPIRGGTDGARLSFMGLPCPNIFAGGLNFHGRYEFLPVKSLEKSMETIVKIAELLVKGNIHHKSQIINHENNSVYRRACRLGREDARIRRFQYAYRIFRNYRRTHDCSEWCRCVRCFPHGRVLGKRPERLGFHSKRNF